MPLEFRSAGLGWDSWYLSAPESSSLNMLSSFSLYFWLIKATEKMKTYYAVKCQIYVGVSSNMDAFNHSPLLTNSFRCIPPSFIMTQLCCVYLKKCLWSVAFKLTQLLFLWSIAQFSFVFSLSLSLSSPLLPWGCEKCHNKSSDWQLYNRYEQEIEKQINRQCRSS